MGVRKPSIKKSIKARTTGKAKRRLKASINPLYGKKGMGYINDPKKAMYNKVYNKTTVGVKDILEDNNQENTGGSLSSIGSFFSLIGSLIQLIVSLAQVIFYGGLLIFILWIIIKILF